MRNQLMLLSAASCLAASHAAVAASPKSHVDEPRFSDTSQAMMIHSGLDSSGGGRATQHQGTAWPDGDGIQAIKAGGHTTVDDSQGAQDHGHLDQP